MRILCSSFQNSAIPCVSASSAKPLHSWGVNPTSAVPFVRTPCLPASSVTLAVMREAGTCQYICPSMLKDGHGSPESVWLGELPVTLSTLQAISTAPSCGKANTCTPGRPPGVDSLMAVAMLRPMAMSCVSMVTLQFMTYGLDPTPAAHQPVTLNILILRCDNLKVGRTCDTKSPLRLWPHIWSDGLQVQWLLEPAYLLPPLRQPPLEGVICPTKQEGAGALDALGESLS